MAPKIVKLCGIESFCRKIAVHSCKNSYLYPMKFTPVADISQTYSSLVKRVEEHALHAFNRYADARRVYNHFALARRTVERVWELGRAEQMEEELVVHLAVAAWLLQMPLDASGLNFAAAPPSPRRLAEIENRLQELSLPEGRRQEMVEWIRTFSSVLAVNRMPSDNRLALLKDAYLAARFGPELEEEWPYRLLEKQLLTGEEPDPLQEKEQLLRTISGLQFFTASAKLNYGPVLARHILWLKQEISKSARRTASAPEPGRKFQKIERKLPSSGIQTFFRANYRNHINLSSIADNKAHIMISVNAILISVLISVISYKNITESQPEILMPVVIFLITGLTSLIFAVLSARPKVTAFRQIPEKDDYKKNLVFFGKFVARPLKDYEEAVDEMFQNSELLYTNLVRDLYNLGLVLDKKYRYLSISYNIFMLGFIATVLTFLLALFLGGD